MLTPQGEEPLPTVSWPVAKTLARSLIRETGVLKGLGLILRSNTWDMITNKPKWHPEYFEFGDEEEEEVFRKYFNLPVSSLVRDAVVTGHRRLLNMSYDESACTTRYAFLEIYEITSFLKRALDRQEMKGDRWL